MHKKSEDLVKAIGLLSGLGEQVLGKAEECANLQAACRSVASHSTLLMQLLELPGMMRTFLDTKNYDAVSQLFDFISRLCFKFPESKAVKHIGAIANGFKQELLDGLTTELRRTTCPADQLIE